MPPVASQSQRVTAAHASRAADAHESHLNPFSSAVSRLTPPRCAFPLRPVARRAFPLSPSRVAPAVFALAPPQTNKQTNKPALNAVRASECRRCTMLVQSPVQVTADATQCAQRAQPQAKNRFPKRHVSEGQAKPAQRLGNTRETRIRILGRRSLPSGPSERDVQLAVLFCGTD